MNFSFTSIAQPLWLVSTPDHHAMAFPSHFAPYSPITHFGDIHAPSSFSSNPSAARSFLPPESSGIPFIPLRPSRAFSFVRDQVETRLPIRSITVAERVVFADILEMRHRDAPSLEKLIIDYETKNESPSADSPELCRMIAWMCYREADYLMAKAQWKQAFHMMDQAMRYLGEWQQGRANDRVGITDNDVARVGSDWAHRVVEWKSVIRRMEKANQDADHLFTKKINGLKTRAALIGVEEDILLIGAEFLAAADEWDRMGYPALVHHVGHYSADKFFDIATVVFSQNDRPIPQEKLRDLRERSSAIHRKSHEDMYYSYECSHPEEKASDDRMMVTPNALEIRFLVRKIAAGLGIVAAGDREIYEALKKSDFIVPIHVVLTALHSILVKMDEGESYDSLKILDVLGDEWHTLHGHLGKEIPDYLIRLLALIAEKTGERLPSEILAIHRRQVRIIQGIFGPSRSEQPALLDDFRGALSDIRFLLDRRDLPVTISHDLVILFESSLERLISSDPRIDDIREEAARLHREIHQRQKEEVVEKVKTVGKQLIQGLMGKLFG